MRLIDLHCNWSLQYARESSQYDPALYPELATRLGQVEGYLTGVSAAFLCCGRRPEDWARQEDPWHTLGEMLARYAAEFSGRLLLQADDLARWQDEPEDGLCWGILALGGLDALIRTDEDLERLPWLVARGIRVVQLVASDGGLLAGSDAPGDDRGLTDLGRAAIERLVGVASSGSSPGRLGLDIARLNARSTADVLSWLEAEAARSDRLLPVRSHGAIATSAGPGATGLDLETLRRFRGLGGTLGLSVGPPYVASAAMLREQIEAVAAISLGNSPGYEGIGIGTDFLGFEEVIPELENSPRILAWLGREFPPAVATGLAQGAALGLLTRLFVR